MEKACRAPLSLKTAPPQGVTQPPSSEACRVGQQPRARFPVYIPAMAWVVTATPPAQFVPSFPWQLPSKFCPSPLVVSVFWVTRLALFLSFSCQYLNFSHTSQSVAVLDLCGTKQPAPLPTSQTRRWQTGPLQQPEPKLAGLCVLSLREHTRDPGSCLAPFLGLIKLCFLNSLVS